jgi:hypothetical protein
VCTSRVGGIRRCHKRRANGSAVDVDIDVAGIPRSILNGGIKDRCEGWEIRWQSGISHEGNRNVDVPFGN